MIDMLRVLWAGLQKKRSFIFKHGEGGSPFLGTGLLSLKSGDY